MRSDAPRTPAAPARPGTGTAPSVQQPDDCDNDEENQYLLHAYTSGAYEACAANGVCVTVPVNR